MEAAFRHLIESLAAGAPAMVDGFFDVRELTADVERRRAASEFHRARVGRGNATQIADAVRRDEICWWKEDDCTDAQRAFLHRIEALRLTLNRELFLGTRDVEVHYAVYAPGSFYRRHLDRFATDDARVVSAVLYLDVDWRDEDGGQLVIDGAPEVFPRAGRLVCFASDRHPHEVLPTRRERRSVALWFRR